MTEADLALKAVSRRLFWRMGFSTRVDVPLRAYIPSGGGRSRAKPSFEAYTDLDVLGIHVATDLRVVSALADCKTSMRGSTERMFWIRGVADFFTADDAYMVRAGPVTAASRQLATRLRIAVLTPDDLTTLENHYPPTADVPETTAEFLFNASHIAQYRASLTQLDKRLRALRDYQEFDFWVYEEHRSLQQLVAHLSAVANELDPANPMHRALFYESAWLYSLSLSRAIQHVRRSHVSDIETSLREYIFGGQVGLREKRQLANVLRNAAGKVVQDPDEGVFPPYFSALLELSSRFIRRPTHISTVLRYGEWAAEAQIADKHSQAVDVFGDSYNDIAAKLLGDVCGFLVHAAGLKQEFRHDSRNLLAPSSDSTSKPFATAHRDSLSTTNDNQPTIFPNTSD